MFERLRKLFKKKTEEPVENQKKNKGRGRWKTDKYTLTSDKGDRRRFNYRTAVKCYLTFNNAATANQLNDFLLGLDLRLRRDLTTNELARELAYCCKNNNFLTIQSHTRKRDNYTLYSLRRG